MTVIDMIRIIGPEFSKVNDEVVSQYVEIVRPMVSRKQFGNLYKQGLSYLVCHKMKMAGLGESPLGELGAIGVGFAVGSVSEGGSSVSFGANQTSNLAADAELGLTAYGVQYLQLRRSVIIPIHCSGMQIESQTSDEEDVELIPTASDSKIGGVRVKPGSGLKINSNGELSIDDATAEETEQLIEDRQNGLLHL